MGKKKKKNKNESQAEDILSTLDDFTSKDNWDQFFTIRGTHDSFEWYSDWPHLHPSLLPHLSFSSAVSPDHHLQLLVPGCGNSRLSEHLYDAGYHAITNLDFSKVVISHMLRRNVRDRPLMKWRVMDITSMQFSDGAFDVVLDKGGLDALMEPEHGAKLGNQYLSEVKRVLKSGGKFICLTLAESHVLGLLFPKFRIGWEMSIYCIPQKSSNKPSLNTFMVVAVKNDSLTVNQIVSSFNQSSLDCNGQQADGLRSALEAENNIRKRYSDGSDIVYSFEDLKIGVKGDLMDISPGRRVQLVLGGQGDSLFRYRAVLLDAQSDCKSFMYHCGIFLVPKTRAHEWLFSSEEGQWMVVESSKAARLIMVLLDSSHSGVSMEEIQKDLSPLVKPLAPQNHDTGSQIPFMMAGDGIKHRKVIHRVASKFTGPIIVEDVIYENVDDNIASTFESKELVFRRLTFQRTEGLVQSEALLKSTTLHDDIRSQESAPASKVKNREKLKSKHQKDVINEVDHTFVASSYHTGIIAGFALISPFLESVASASRKVETVIIGLGAGLLPMFLHRCMQFLHVEVVELDPVVVRLAKEFFGFCEDEQLKVHVADGIKFLKNLAESSAGEAIIDGKEETINNNDMPSSHLSHVSSNLSKQLLKKPDIIIVDADSSDSSTGLSCPAEEFIEDTFLVTVRDVLSEQGLFIINLVSRSPSIKETVISRMKGVFSHLFCLEIEEDVNEVLFAANSSTVMVDDDISKAAIQLDKLLKIDEADRRQGIIKTAKKLKRLK